MSVAGLGQAELARRIGVSQPTIYRVVHGEVYGTTHLHKIARELGTTPAYLVGETDDPDANAPPPPPPQPQIVMLGVVLPAEHVLAQMFEGMLEAVDRSGPVDELARELAQLLPISLSQLRDVLPDRVRPAAPPARAPAVLATADHG